MGMTVTAFADMTLSEASSMIARREVTATELTQSCLRRLEESNSSLNIAVRIEAESALQAAAEADRPLQRGTAPGPLHGIPLAHKDMFHRSGKQCAFGSRVPVELATGGTATLLARLDAAGAIDIARLHMSEFALGATGHNEIIGDARNPWNPDHVPGGSSSGSAVAVACGGAFGALGSDTGGSIRQPAAFCGVVGFKPTTGRLSRYGMMPLSYTIDSAGIIARTVEDCAILFSAIAGHDTADPTTVDMPVNAVTDDLDPPLEGTRIGVAPDFFHVDIDPEVEQRVNEALAVFRGLGARIVPLRLRSIELASPMLGIIVAVEAAALHEHWIKSCPELYGAQTLARLLPGLNYTGTEYLDALTRRAHILREFAEGVFANADLLLTPTMPMQPPTLQEADVGDRPGFMEYLAPFGRCTRPASLLGLPAISIPAGFTSSGLPCGIQLVGRPFDEGRLFAAGRAFEREADRRTRPRFLCQHSNSAAAPGRSA